MNWYKKNIKISSVTFNISGSENISQPMTLGDISWDLFNFVWYKSDLGKMIGSNNMDFDVDGDSDHLGDIGTINLYLRRPQEEGKQYIQKAIDKYNEYRFGSIVLRFMGIETSGLDNKTKVARILVIQNNTSSFQSLPQMNLSNTNASSLLRMLKTYGVHINGDESVGSIDINSLRNFLNNIDNETLSLYTKDKTVKHEEGMYPVIDYGRSIEQMERYINELQKMINYIDRYDLPDKTINYA